MFATAADLIDSRGGNAVVARDTGYSESAVGVWKHRNRVPRAAWPEIMSAYPDVDLRALLRLERMSGGGKSRGHGQKLAPPPPAGAENSDVNITRTEAGA